jgi:RecB family endonuclease NucS
MDIFKTATENTTETVMKDHLETILQGQATQQNPIVVQREYGVWDSTSLDIHSTHQGQQTIIAYECKKGRACALDLYQLIMYCDGLHQQGNPADVGILVANQYAPDVVQIMQQKNGANYHTTLERHTWQDLTGLNIVPYGDANPVVGP